MTPRRTCDPTIGERIQARRLLRGWSIRYAASRAGLSHATWSRIERGLQAADNRFVLADIAGALDCAPADLAGVAVPAADRAVVAAQAGVRGIRRALIDIDLLARPPLPAGRTAPPTDPDPAHPAALPTGLDPTHPAGPATGPDPTHPAGPATGPDPTHPADLAIGSGPIGLPVPSVAESARALDLIDSLRQACDYAGSARLLPPLLRDLHASTAGPDRVAALRLLCQATFIASSVLRNLGHPADAWLGAERCRDAADAIGDPVLRGYAAYARAGAATACGSYDRGLALAAHAVDALRPHAGRPGGAETLGTLLLMCAYASRGGRRLDDSRAWSAEAAELAGRTGETTAMGLYFGPANVGIWRIGIEADGGDPGRAAEIARRTDPAVIGAGFRQVFYYADTARALARLRGKDREAVRFLLTAERIAPQHVPTSAMAQETTRALLERSRRMAGGSELRALCERMQVA